MYSRISGTGSYLPETVVTNFDLEKRMDTSDVWIRERTGIERRHILPEGQSNVDMAEHASRAAIAAAGLQPGDIDLISYGTTTPDLIFPNAGVLLQARLGCRGGAAFALEAACSGFIYALAVADKFVRTGSVRRALVVGMPLFTAEEQQRQLEKYSEQPLKPATEGGHVLGAWRGGLAFREPPYDLGDTHRRFVEHVLANTVQQRRST